MAMKKKSGKPPAKKAGKPKSMKSAAPKKSARKAAPKKAAKKPVAKKAAPKKSAARAAAKPRRAAAKPAPAPPKPGLVRFAGGVSVSITADDLPKSMAFYNGVLGFAVTERWEKDGAVAGCELRSGEAVLMLLQDDWAKGTDRKKGVGMRLHLRTAESIDAVAEKFRSRGLSLDGEVEDSPWGRYFMFVDPDDVKYTVMAT